MIVVIYRYLENIRRSSGWCKKLSLVSVESYEFILDNNCILHKANVNIGGEHSETIGMITGIYNSMLVGNWCMRATNGDWKQFIALKLEKYQKQGF